MYYDENNQKSIQELASIYEQKKDGNAPVSYTHLAGLYSDTIVFTISYK